MILEFSLSRSVSVALCHWVFWSTAASVSMYTFLTAGRMLAEKHRSALAKAPIQALGARSLSAVASSRREIRKLCTIRISENTPVLRISQTVRQLALILVNF